MNSFVRITPSMIHCEISVMLLVDTRREFAVSEASDLRIIVSGKALGLEEDLITDFDTPKGPWRRFDDMDYVRTEPDSIHYLDKPLKPGIEDALSEYHPPTKSRKALTKFILQVQAGISNHLAKVRSPVLVGSRKAGTLMVSTPDGLPGIDKRRSMPDNMVRSMPTDRIWSARSGIEEEPFMSGCKRFILEQDRLQPDGS